MTRTEQGVALIKELWARRAVRIAAVAAAGVFLLLTGLFAFFYAKYRRIVDERVQRPMFDNSAKIYAAPLTVRPGEKWTLAEIVEHLRRSGFSNTGAPEAGTFAIEGSRLRVVPGPGSVFAKRAATLTFDGGTLKSIANESGQNVRSYEFEPQLVTGLFDARERAKRRVLDYENIPKVVIDAVVSIEDRRFFEHNGINYLRLAEGLLTPVLQGRRMQGGSTLTMQMARSFFLTNERRLGRKLAEMMIALQLEQRFSKQEILALYVNQVDLGQRGSFTVKGFGEGALAYFGKDIHSLSLPEAALLAGIVNGPSYYSPYRHPERATERRNLVLRSMVDNNAITEAQFAAAKAAPLALAPPNVDANQAPYYIDLVRDQLMANYQETELNENGLRVYTALDPQLQQAASEAIAAGLEQVDDLVRKQAPKGAKPGPLPQVALVVLDPATGAVLALSGGRNYGQSQLNRALAKRPTGSIFKPFVYATALAGGEFTQASLLDASEAEFTFKGETYRPHNFDPKDTMPEISARYALAHSVNTATVRLAEAIGYDKVAQLARAAGLPNIKATPAMALGAYDASPLEMAGAYTVFANGGVRTTPRLVMSVRDAEGNVMQEFPVEKKQVLDPKIAFLATDMMQAVVNEGTASGAVRRRFWLPAAGKTGSSHDAWFAGYTTNLVCIVWVGHDDYTDIKIEGAKAAAPIWAEFMVRASKYARYNAMRPFTPPPGVVQAHLDKVTNLISTPACPDAYDAYFLEGTAPTETCTGGRDREDEPGKKRGFWRRLFGRGGNE